MGKTKIAIASALLLLVFSGLSSAQMVASVVHTMHTIDSRVLGEKRTILVRLPANYDKSTERFPVVYMLDAHPPQNAMMAGIVEQQAWGQQIPEMIIVGIQNTNRSRDLTPTDDGKGGSVGGGAKFLEYIEKEVIPLVDSTYRTQPYRIFAGHSLGGLFAMYTFAARPTLFNAYIAASPVLNYDNDVVVQQAEEMLKRDPDVQSTIFIGVGNEPEMMHGINAFQDVIKKLKPKNLTFEFREFKDENHPSVVLPAYYAGLRKIYAGWLPPDKGTVAELREHYRKLSKRFGYKIVAPEDLMNEVGYQLLKSGKTEDAIEVFKQNAENYPGSANCYDSLAEAQEKAGLTREALANYDRSAKMAEADGNAELARIAKASYDKLAARQRK